MEWSQYSAEFLAMALAHLVAVASPGPDFAIVMKHSINYGKRIAIITSIGIATAIFVHIAYAIAGIGLIINSTPWLYNGLIVAASTFLIYIGVGAIRATPSAMDTDGKQEVKAITDKKAFVLGFMTNGLNPKATIFFISLFTAIVDASTPILVKGGYGLYLAFATLVWFVTLSLLLSHYKVRQLFSRNGYIFDRIMGWVLIFLALNILYSEFIQPLIKSSLA